MNRILKAIFGAGLIAGTIDIGMAAAINAANPALILRGIASGLLGAAAYREAQWVVVLGLALQWIMSMVIAAVFVLASERLPVLLRRWALAGLAYGIVVFVVMSFIVVPLSAAVPKPHVTLLWFGENVLAMLLFGLMVAFFARHFAARGPGPTVIF